MPIGWMPGCGRNSRAADGWREADPWRCGLDAGSHTAALAWPDRHRRHRGDSGIPCRFLLGRERGPSKNVIGRRGEELYFWEARERPLIESRKVRNYHVQNFGCRASQADGAALEAALSSEGWNAAAPNQADLVVLNTCTVTALADEDVRKAVHRVHRENPEARILLTGCYAQRAPAELAVLPGVYWVVGNSHKTQIAEIVRETHAPYHGEAGVGPEIRVGDIFAQHDFLSSPVEDAAGDRTRPNLKIQDGCNNRCSFCIIPFVRGRSRSAPAGQVIEQ